MSQNDQNTLDGRVVHFITGATGLYGAEYLHAVLSSDTKSQCALLIHANSRSVAEIRVNELMHYLFENGELHDQMRQRIEVYYGDISEKHFGLAENEWLSLAEKTRFIFHAAANSKLSDSKHALNAVNVMGTVSVLNFAKRCKHLVRMMHVSSAYVSGTKTGVISPDELDLKQPTSDDFQLSKRVAEVLVREHWHKLPIVIVRPSTLVGHSVLGRTNTYKAFYYPTRMLIMGHRVFFPASRFGKVEAIPVDWAARIALKLMHARGVNGRCFHLSMGERAYTMSQIERIITKSIDKHGIEYKQAKIIPRLGYKIFIAPLVSILYPQGRSLNRDFNLLSNYSCIDRIFDNKATFRATSEDRHNLPGLEGYFDKLLSYAMKNRWHNIKSHNWSRHSGR